MVILGRPRMLLTLFIFGYSVCSVLCIPQLLFSNHDDIRIVDADPLVKPSVSRNSTILLGALPGATSVDFLYQTDQYGNDTSVICWGDAALEKISCGNRSSSRPFTSKQIVSAGLRYPDGIAIDWVTYKLYWVDAKRKRIEVCDLFTGNYRKVLYWTRLDQLRALALNPYTGYMYWTDWGVSPKIERAAMNGDQSSRSILVSDDIVWPNGLTIDFTDDRIYWSDAQLNYIHSIDMDGNDRRVIRAGNLPHPYGITVFNDRLYWTDWKKKSILSCSKNDCTDVDTILSDLRYPMDIDVYESSRQPVPDNNPCGVDNGGCSHLCLLAPVGSVNCACPSGIKLKSDNKTCASAATTMLFLARNSDIRRISLDSPDFTDRVIPVEQVSHAITIDFDPVDQYVYWTDDEVRLIQRAKLDGSEQQSVVTAEVLNPDGIAIDWISRNMYWTDTGTDRIEVARLNGTSRRTLIADNLNEPRAITVDPINGWIYWTDWGKPAKIEKAYGDGTNRQILIVDGDLQWPNGIAIDFKQNKLYWADAMSDRIERANLDGSEREIVLEIKYSHIFGFDIVGDYMYWTDWQRRKLERKNMYNPDSSIELVTEQLSDLMGIRTVYMTVDIDDANGCSVNYGGCSHLCLPTPDGVICSCPMGMELLPDNKSCITPEAFLLFSQEKMIKTVSIQHTHKETLLPIQQLSNVTAIDIHVGKELLYFTDNVNSSIRQSFLNGSSVKLVLELVNESPGPMSIDWISDNIYFIEETRRRIEVYNMRTQARKIVLWSVLGDPRSLAVHPPAGFLYWTDFNQDGRGSTVIGRSNLTGEDHRFILTNIGRCGSITVDLESNRIFWINYDRKSIQSAGLSGENMEPIKQGLRTPVSLNIYGNYIYWYDASSKQIRRVNKINRTDEAVLQENIDSMINLIVFHDSRQSGWSTCENNNGGCEFFCFNTGRTSGIKCGCPTHYKLNDDNKTCSAPNNFLLLSEKPYNPISCYNPKCKEMQIMRILDENVPDVVLPMSSLKSVKTLEFDPDNNKIYWIDSNLKAVKRSSVDGSQVEVFLRHTTFSPSSIAIDPYSRRLFWADSESRIVNVTTLDQIAVGIIINRSDFKPLAIAIHPYKGYLFIITEPGLRDRRNMVLRCTLDGKNLGSIIEGEDIRALTVDSQADKLYFSQISSKSVLSSSLDGSDVRTLVTGVEAEALTIYNNKLYYTQGSSLVYVDKESGQNARFLARDIANITDLHAVNANAYADKLLHPCSINNGDCSHICYINIDGKKQCGCPHGLVLHQNMMTCESPPTCKPTDFTCESGRVPCVPYEWVCDGRPECEDKSDEKNCPSNCKDKEFTCDNGECIQESLVCNKIADCLDSSDEQRCCSENEYRCPDSGTCIPASRKVDGVNDCTDGSDENQPVSPVTKSSSKSKDPFAVGIVIVSCIVSVAIVCIISFIVWRYHKRTSTLRYDDDNSLATLRHGTTLEPNITDNGVGMIPQSITATTVVSASSTSGGVYDRNHVTGASSSSSSITHLQSGYNPPPSPVTERSACVGRRVMGDDVSTVVSSACPSYHSAMKRNRVPAPPTTPISTCDDSEPSVVNYSTQKTRVRKKSNKKYQLLNSYSSHEPYPPPPTPIRSRVYSGDEASECPPSPSTVRSYRSTANNPQPPPPSPEPPSDNNS